MLKLVALSVVKSGSACARMLVASSCSLQSKRTLISEHVFGQEVRAEQRTQYLQKLRSAGLTRETYIAKLHEHIVKQEVDALLWADLNILLALAQTKSDVRLAQAMLKRLQARGPVPKQVVNNLIRMCRDLDLPDAALEFYRDPSLAKTFSKHNGVLLSLLDLTYESGRFETVVDLFEARKAQDPQWACSECTLLFAASCYRLGTAESLEKLQKSIGDLLKTGQLTINQFCLVALLAIKQKQFDLFNTLQQRMIRREHSSNIVIVRMLKAIAIGDNNELDSLLQLALNNGLVVTSDVFNSITALITKLNADTNEAAQKQAGQFSSMLKRITDAKLLRLNTLEDRLLRPSSKTTSASRNVEATQSNQANAPRRDKARSAESKQSEVNVSSPSRRGRTGRPENDRRPFPPDTPGTHADSPPRTPTAAQSGQPWPYGAPDYQGHYFIPGWIVPSTYFGQPNWPPMQGAPVWPPFDPSNKPVAPHTYPPQPRWPVAPQSWYAPPRGRPWPPRPPFATPPQYGQPRARYGAPNDDAQSGASRSRDAERPQEETTKKQDPDIPQPNRWNRRRWQRYSVGSTQDTQDSQAQTNGSQPQTLNKDDGKTHSG